MNKISLKLILPLAVLAVPASVLAEPAQEWRCSTDSLTPGQALQRIEWARKCGLQLNTAGANSWVASTKAFDTTFNWAKEYVENTTIKAFTGNLHTYNINYYYGYARYETTPMYTVAQETTGPTINFWKWSHTTQRLRPMYASFESSSMAGGGTQLFPHPTYADCSLYTDNTGSVAAKWPTANAFFVIAMCESSCYAPDQNLRFSTGDVNIVDAMKAGRDDVVTLSPDATLDNLATQTSQVFSYTTETRDSEHVIFKLTTASGGKLSVTNEHPMVTSEGRLVKAQDLKQGEELLKANGTPDAIVSIAKTTHFGKVYNIKPASLDHVSNILIAQGYLVGSARFQNDDVDYMNRVLLFRAVPEIAMPK